MPSHFCSQCGHELSQGDKLCRHCGRAVAYLTDVPVFPEIMEQKTKTRSTSIWRSWVIFYLVACVSIFLISYFYFSSPALQAFFNSPKPPVAVVTSAPEPSGQPTPAVLKNAYNRLSANAQRAMVIADDYRKAGVPGDPVRTAANYRKVSQIADTLLAETVLPPDAPTETSNIAVPLKESIGLTGKAASIMADYLEGKLSLTPPNPDWVARAQDYFAQSQARLKETNQMLLVLRKKFE